MVPSQEIGEAANGSRIVADPDIARRVPGFTFFKGKNMSLIGC